jgi:hypothetical protein
MSSAWIIEPHMDDILFSCPELLMQYENICITTFHHSKDRPNTIYNVFGPHIRCMTLPVHEIGSGHAGSFHRDRAHWCEVVRRVGCELEVYEDVYRSLAETYADIYLPFGIKHPHHIVVSDYFTEFLRFCDPIYYMDRPYYDICLPEVYARPLATPLVVVETPELDRYELMVNLLQKQFWIGRVRGIEDSKYTPMKEYL